MDGKHQTIDTVCDCGVTSPQLRQIYLGWQKENGRKYIITIKNHSTTNDIHMRRHFQVMCGI